MRIRLARFFLMELLELRWREHIERAVAPPAVVERLDVFEDRPPLPDGITFHSLRRTYAALRAELGEHPAITAAQMGHRDPRMTLRVYTDATGMKPLTKMGGLLSNASWHHPETEIRDN